MKTQSKKSNPIYYQEAGRLAQMIRNKKITPVEVVQAHLDRVAENNPRINGVATLFEMLKTQLIPAITNISSILIFSNHMFFRSIIIVLPIRISLYKGISPIIH